MRKGIKILGKVVSTIVLLLIFLPIVVTLVLNVESVQNAVVRRTLHYASDLLGTDVYVDGIDFDLFSKVRVRGLYVEDYNQDTLLYVAHATTSIDGFNIAKDGLRLSNTKMYGAKLYLRELPSGEMNIRPILEQLQNRDKESNFRLYVDDVDAENLAFCLEKLERRNPEYGVDVSNIHLDDIAAHLTNFAVVRGAVWMDVEHLSMVERSGFEITELTSHLYINQGEMSLDGLNLQTESSSLYSPKLELKGEGWDSYKRFANDVELNIGFEHSRLSTKDIAYFVPSLREVDIDVKSLSAQVEGYLRDVDIRLKRAKLGAATDIALRCSIEGLPYWREARYVVGVDKLYSTSGDVMMVAHSIVQDAISEEAWGVIERVKWVDARAKMSGVVGDFKIGGNIYSGAGDISGDVALKSVEDARMAITGAVQSVDLNIGDLLSVESLNTVTSAVTFDGSVGARDSGGIIGDVGVDVESVGFKSYTFSTIGVEGRISGDDFLAEVNSLDPNLRFDLRADVNLDSQRPTYIASIALQRADLRALGINKRDSLSVLSANIGVDLQGVLTDGVDGYISIADIEYDYPQGKFVEDRVKVEFENQGYFKSIQLSSDFVNIDYDSNSTYLVGSNYLYNALRYYAPLLYDGSEPWYVSHDGGSPNDYTALNVRAGENINELLQAIVGGLMVAPDTTFDLRFNPAGNAFSLRGESDAVQFKDWIVADWECDVNNDRVHDFLEVRLDTDGLFYGTNPVMPNLCISGGVSNNIVNVEASFADDAPNGNSAKVALNAELLRNAKTGQRNIFVDVVPSYFYNSAERWDLTSQGVLIEPSRITVNNFLVARPDQQLILDGVMSRSLSDSIRLTLNNFDISGVSMLLKRTGYEISGVSNGYAVVQSAFRGPEVEASIAIDKMSVNGLSVAPQIIASTWDKVGNRAHIIVKDRGLNKTVIDGYYSPNENRYSADINIANADIALLKPYLKSVLNDMEGKLNIYAYIEGEGRKAVLSGSAIANSFAATVGYTKARYRAPSARFTLENNHLLASRIPLYDADGNVGFLKMDVDLGNLSNVTYDISAEVNKMLVLNTTAKDNDTFYGHVYATGEASFKGDKRGTKMDIDVTSSDNSKFYLPLQRKEDVSYANFVRFVEPDVEKVDSIDFLTRLMMSYERRTKAVNTPSRLMDININVNVLPNIEMQLVIDPTMGDIIKAKGAGELS